MAFRIHAEMDSHCKGGRLRLKPFCRSSRSWTISRSSLALSGGSASSLQTRAPISTATPALIYHRGRDRQHICARTDRVRKEGSEGGTTLWVGGGKSRRKYGSGEDWDRTFGEAFQGSYFVWRASSYPSCDLSLYPSASSSITGCQLTPLATGRSLS